MLQRKNHTVVHGPREAIVLHPTQQLKQIELLLARQHCNADREAASLAAKLPLLLRECARSDRASA